jgi:hypothetical protein
MYDLKRTHFSLTLQKNVTPGSVVDREGVCLRSVLTSGAETVQKADGSAATYQIAGFAISDNEQIGVIPWVEDAVIPASPGPYQVQLHYNALTGTPPTAQVRVAYASGAPFTQVNTTPVGAGTFQPIVAGSVTTGLLQFYSGDAGAAIRVWYRASLTLAQSQQKFYQRNINNTAGILFNTVAVGGGVGEIYTSEFDPNVDWSTAVPGSTGVIKTGPDGILTIGGSGTAVPGARVVHVPDPNIMMLGIAFVLAP